MELGIAARPQLGIAQIVLFHIGVAQSEGCGPTVIDRVGIMGKYRPFLCFALQEGIDSQIQESQFRDKRRRGGHDGACANQGHFAVGLRVRVEKSED